MLENIEIKGLTIRELIDGSLSVTIHLPSIIEYAASRTGCLRLNLKKRAKPFLKDGKLYTHHLPTLDISKKTEPSDTGSKQLFEDEEKI